MYYYKYFFFLVLVFASSCTSKEAKNVIINEINSGWTFKQADKDHWMDASVPGCVHTDLINEGLIDDPFYRLNEHEVQWIDKKDWIYKTNINIDAAILQKDRVVLNFKGLDTHADVYLNEKKILVADNMFRDWETDVKEILQTGQNELKILFHSPIKIGLEKFDNYPHVIQSSPNDLAEIGQVPGKKWVSPHIRKAQSHFGWDWGPRLVTSGIWKPVYLKAWDEVRLLDLKINQNKIGDKLAELEAEFEIEAEKDLEHALLEIKVNDKKSVSANVSLKKGISKHSVKFKIDDPKLWWTNGLGDAYLYNISGSILGDKGKDKLAHNIGLRTIEVVREKDQYGKSFYIKLNGVPVFMKGSNSIPADAFLNRVDYKKYQHIIESAKACNHNMIRVWGGGIYESDEFYDLCDENGILVWQDFMFACNMYPGHPEFLESVKEEAIDNIKRLRNHPSLALWCGNNEVLIAWFNWGWKKRWEEEEPDGAIAQWKAYKDIFLDVLPSAVNEFDPGRFYWASSPQASDSISRDFDNGDHHYWGVWWGKEPFSNYHTNLARFMSEYGFQSFPEYNTVKKYTKEEDWDIYSEVMKSHQRSSIGNKTIELYLLRDYKKPEKFEDFLYVGQVLQAEGTRQAMEGHRIAMPYTMGSLYWQLNDCWPVASWSSMDYYGNWKAMQYFSKKAFANILVAPRLEGDTLKTYVVSDKLESIDGDLNLKLLDFNGNEIWSDNRTIKVKSNTSEVYYSVDVNEILKGTNRKDVLLIATLKQDSKMLGENKYYFLPIKDIELPIVKLSSQITKSEKGFEIAISSDKLAKNVFVSCDSVEGFFSDNYFDLIPGETKTITFEPNNSSSQSSLEEVKRNLRLKSIRDTY